MDENRTLNDSGATNSETAKSTTSKRSLDCGESLLFALLAAVVVPLGAESCDDEDVAPANDDEAVW